MINKISSLVAALAIILFSGHAMAQATSVLYMTTDEGQGEEVGTVIFTDTDEGVKIEYNLKGLTPGERGFHVHEKPDCSPVTHDGMTTHAAAAGGHYDPEKTGKHLGPDGDGHRGDLPRLVVSEDGTAIGSAVFGKEKGLKTEEFRDRAIMIHAGGDNYSDQPAALGGGGARIACGIIE